MFKKHILAAAALGLMCVSGVAMADVVMLHATIPNGPSADRAFHDKAYNFSYLSATDSGNADHSIGTVYEDSYGNLGSPQFASINAAQEDVKDGLAIKVSVSAGRPGLSAEADTLEGTYCSVRPIVPNGDVLSVTFNPINSPNDWRRC